MNPIRRFPIYGALSLATALAAPLAAQTPAPATLVVESSAYQNNQPIPATYTVDGQNVSPPVTWKGAPAATKEFTVVFEDVTNGFVHWTIYKIPGTATGLPQGVPAGAILPATAGAIAGAMQGPAAAGGGGGRGGRGGAGGPPGAPGAAPGGAPAGAPPPPPPAAAPAPTYRPPAPPQGAPHNYRFTVYALDAALDLMPGLNKPALVTAMTGHILAQGELTGSYTRRAPAP